MVDGFGISGIQQHSTIVMLSEAKDHCTFATDKLRRPFDSLRMTNTLKGN
jgi:hypothetical protein